MTAAMMIFGVLTVLSACGVVFSVKSLHSALWLVVTLFLVAVHFALVGADFLAALQVMVYAGAIMVLVIFVIMLLGLNEKGEPGRLNVRVLSAVAVTGVFIGMLFFMVQTPSLMPSLGAASAVHSDQPIAGTPQAVGHVLFTKFLYPFEVTSLLLLGAIIGAVVLAFEPKRPLPQGRGLKAKHSPGEKYV
ncbi:MAG: NADH-quinone oxidoreductase subunit J [Bdellovibrionota bacterium]